MVDTRGGLTRFGIRNNIAFFKLNCSEYNSFTMTQNVFSIFFSDTYLYVYFYLENCTLTKL